MKYVNVKKNIEDFKNHESKSYRRLILGIRLNQHVNIFKLARKGDLESIKKLKDDKSIDWYKHDNKVLKDAAIQGHLNVVKYLIEEAKLFNKQHLASIMPSVFANGYLDMIKYYFQNVKPAKCSLYATFAAARHLNIIKYFIEEQHITFPKQELNRWLKKAIRFGNFKVVKYLVENGADLDEACVILQDPIELARIFSRKNKKILPYLLEKKREILFGLQAK
jgi:ankyrin repeat protein